MEIYKELNELEDKIKFSINYDKLEFIKKVELICNLIGRFIGEDWKVRLKSYCWDGHPTEIEYDENLYKNCKMLENISFTHFVTLERFDNSGFCKEMWNLFCFIFSTNKCVILRCCYEDNKWKYYASAGYDEAIKFMIKFYQKINQS